MEQLESLIEYDVEGDEISFKTKNQNSEPRVNRMIKDLKLNRYDLLKDRRIFLRFLNFAIGNYQGATSIHDKKEATEMLKFMKNKNNEFAGLARNHLEFHAIVID